MLLPPETQFMTVPLLARARQAGAAAPLSAVAENLLYVGGPSYTLSEEDHGRTLVFAAAMACTLTIPAGLPRFQRTDILQWDDYSEVSLSAAGGVRLTSASGKIATSGKGSLLRLLAVLGDDWAVFLLSSTEILTSE